MVQLEVFKNYLILALIGLMICLYFYKDYKYNSLQDEFNILKANEEQAISDKENYKAQVTVCAENLRIVTEQLQKSSEETKVALKKYEEFKNQPKEVKYKTIYKNVKGNSNECEDIKNAINIIRSLNINGL